MNDKKVPYAPIYGENPFVIVRGWSRAARGAGWTQEEVEKVKTEVFNASSSYIDLVWLLAS